MPNSIDPAPTSVDTPPPSDLAPQLTRAVDAVAALRDGWSRRYTEVVCDVAVSADPEGKGVHLTGTVLLPAQRSAIVTQVRAAVDAVPVTAEIEALIERASHAGWASPASAVCDVRARPGGDLATQLVAGDPPARRLARRGAWWAVELADGTVGWVRVADLVDAPDGRTPPDVATWRADYAGMPPVEAPPAEVWQAALAPWLSTPYVWGGSSPGGIDCSGLTQRLYRRVMGIGLPKHSRDQVRAGRRIGREALAVGDLVYLTHVQRGIGHVGVVVHDDPVAVAHASFDADAVVVEELGEMLGRYRWRGGRRFTRRIDGATQRIDKRIHGLSGLDRLAGEGIGESVGRGGGGDEGSGAGEWSDLSRGAGDLERRAQWDALRALADRDVHVVGVAGTEGAAVARFLWAEGVRRLTVHDFQPEDEVERAFRRMHVGMAAEERDRVWRELAALPIERRFGERYLGGIETADVIFASQAWYLYPPNLPKLSDLRAAGVPFRGITELYFDLAPARILAVTGSNGKSTTSRLIETIMRLTGQTIYYAGNERRSTQVLDKLRRMGPEDWLILEISNRHLIDLDPHPRIGVVTNVLPNHLEEHGGSFDAYAAVKRKLVGRQGAADFAVLNADNPVTRAMAGGLDGQVFWFSRRGTVDRGAWLAEGRICLRREVDAPAVDAGPIGAARVPGEHNVENVLAAALASWLAGAQPDAIRRGIAMFRGLRHRLQFVWGVRGVAYYDDLNSTTPQATIAALAALDPPIVLIAGGDDKGLDFEDLARHIVARVRRLVLLPGPGSDRIEAAVRAVDVAGGREIDRFDTLPEALADIVAEARSGDKVLLSPACPFFFSQHYLAGGEELGFRALLRDLTT